MSSRSLALKVLLKVERKRTFADETFLLLAQKAKLSKNNTGLAFELVYGVLRHRETLDWRLNLITTRPLLRLPLIIVMILRLGAYQILYLDRIPASAAVNESVRLAKGVKGRDWSGVVNGVLRTLIRQPVPVWPDNSVDPVMALSIHNSCPLWLTKRWIDRLGFEQAEKACHETSTVPPLTLRTNTLLCSPSQLEERLRNEGYSVARTSVSPVGLVLKKCGPLTDLSALLEGWFYVEDEAAQLVPLLLDVRPGHTVLDACAAPGGKTTHLAALMKNQGKIIAADRNPRRLKTLTSNAARLGITCIEPICGTFAQDSQHSPKMNALIKDGFDRILVDAPCSGLGTLRRHPEAKWQKASQELLKKQLLQLEILNCVSTLLRHGGVLVYSACSTEPEESTQVIAKFCRDHPEFSHESSASWLPTIGRALVNEDGDLWTMVSNYEMDGFFAARLRKG